MTPLYKPSPWGLMYHTVEGVDELMGGGSAGPGKSLVLLMDPIYQLMVEHERCSNKKHPFHMPWGHSKGWALHLRREYQMLKQTMDRAARIFPSIDQGVRYDAESRIWEFSCGYKYQFSHCKDPDDWQGFMSNEYTWIGFDELVQFEEEQYDQISGRLRSSDPVLAKMLKVRSMSNPLMKREDGQTSVVKDPYWVRKRFVEPGVTGNVKLKRRLLRSTGEIAWHVMMFMPALLKDNPDPEFVRSYEKTLLAKKPHIRKALLEGDWYVTAGSFYGEDWSAQIHTCKPFKIPKDWPQFRSMDWGYKKPGCVHWYALDPEDTLYVHRELTFQGKSATEVALRIREIEEDLGTWQGKYSRITGPADTQLWEQRGESGVSKAAEMSQKGVTWTRADKRSRQRNGERLLGRLKNHERGTQTPGIVLFHGCKMAIQTIPSIPTSTTNPEEPMDGGEDHWHDSIGYGCAHASRGRAGIANIPEDKEDWEEDVVRDRLSGTRRGTFQRSRFGYG